MDGHHCLLQSMNYPQYNSFGNMSDQMTKNAPPTDPDPSLSSSNNLGFCFMSRFNRYAPFFSFWVPNDFKTEVHNLQFSGLKSQVEHQSILFIIQRDWVSIRVSFISKQVPIKQNANTLPFPKIGQHIAEKFCFMNQWILVIV